MSFNKRILFIFLTMLLVIFAAVPSLLAEGYSKPSISKVAMTPNPFSPNADGKKDTTSFGYKLANEARVTIKVFDYKGEVKTVISNVYRSAGKHYEGWTGTNNDKRVMRNGNYRYEIFATNRAGNEKASGVTALLSPVPKITSTWMNPNPFSPNADGKKDTTSFCYTLDVAAKVTIKVYNMAGVVRTVISNVDRKAGRHYEGWTGTGDNAKTLENGNYKYTITAETVGGITEYSRTVSIIGVPDGRLSILIDRSKRRLYLYKGNTIIRSYPVAVGMKGFETPIGKYTVVRKDINPTWYPPSWADETQPVKYPASPLGPRRLLLSDRSYGIHGTLSESAIGKAVTHGCIRLHNKDIKELYNLVSVGIKVSIIE